MAKTYLESFRPGYPRVAALLGNREQFRIFRRFATVRMRLILNKQDDISMLEAQLHEIDNTEERVIFLGARRRDKNQQRLDKLKELDAALIEYDRLLESGEQITRRKPPALDDVRTLRTWFSEGFLARDEIKYLDYMDGIDDSLDLLSLHESSEPTLQPLGQWIQDLLLRILKRSQKRPETTLTDDQGFIVLSDKYFEVAARALVASFTIVLLLAPVVILNFVNKTALRFVIIFISAAFFVSAVTIISKAKAVEIFVAGATYAAVLVVFVSGNGVVSPQP